MDTIIEVLKALPADVRICLFILGGVFLFAGIFTVNVKGVLVIDAGSGGRAVASAVGAILLLFGSLSALPSPPKPLSAEEHYQKGESLLDNHDDNGAIPELKAAARKFASEPCMAVEPWAPKLFADLGRAQLNVGNSEDAKLSFEQSLCLTPDNNEPAKTGLERATTGEALASIYLNLGGTLDKLARPGDAEKIYTGYIGLAADNPEGYEKRGEARNNNKEYDSAAADFARADQLLKAHSDWWQTQAFTDKGWGYALLYKTPRDCQAALQKFTAANQLFAHHNYAEQATTDGLFQAQRCSQ